jgi:hypothetical protein
MIAQSQTTDSLAFVFDLRINVQPDTLPDNLGFISSEQVSQFGGVGLIADQGLRVLKMTDQFDLRISPFPSHVRLREVRDFEDYPRFFPDPIFWEIF